MTLTFPGIRPQSKRAPQFTGKFAYVEPHYKRWRDLFGMLARGQWLVMELGPGGMRIDAREPLAEPVSVHVEFRTASGIMRGDLDNSFAAVADGLQDGGVLANDKWIRELSAKVVKAAKKDVGIVVTIERIGDG